MKCSAFLQVLHAQGTAQFGNNFVRFGIFSCHVGCPLVGLRKGRASSRPTHQEETGIKLLFTVKMF
jgi:hypothetical protein